MSSPDEDPVTFRAAFATPSHYKTNLSRASVAHSRLCSSRKPFQVKWTACTDERVPNSPNLLVNSWANSRKISSTVDLSRRFISVLFVSNRCRRAAYAEKQLLQIAEHYSISRRLLILSAGLHAKPGDIIPWRIISAAQKRQIDLTDERPCASFDISDIEHYDFVVVVDRNIKDKLLHMAAAHAHLSGGHLYEWERKIRLLCDFDAVMLDSHNSGSMPLDVPSFDSSEQMGTSMDIMTAGCERLVRSLLSAGL